MSDFDFTYDLESVTRITAHAIGEPGKRIFYVQARSNRQIVSLVAEKDQVAALAQAIDQLLEDLAEKNPLLSSPDDLLPIFDMSLEEPLEPVFRIAQLRLGYDEDEDVVVLVALGWPEGEEETPPTARFNVTRQQIRALSEHASQVVSKGRRICGNCARPIDASGHFCPRMN